jgi:60 kDa SS-A/Ro ribonucleoprotein
VPTAQYTCAVDSFMKNVPFSSKFLSATGADFSAFSKISFYCAVSLRSAVSALHCQPGTTKDNITNQQKPFKMRFNILNRIKAKVLNHEGATAFSMTPEAELYATVVTSSLGDTFYEGADDRVERIGKLISKINPEFVAKLAVYARTQMNMRSVPLVLAVELAKKTTGNGLVSKTVKGVVKRADEITELLAYYQLANKREGEKKLNRLSKQVQKGLAQSFNAFDEYQFAKYNRPGAVKLRDALFLVHPKAKDDSQQALFDKIAADTLATPYTWETEMSGIGQKDFEGKKAKLAAMKQTWEELIDSGKLGYMAALRNLRNMLAYDVSDEHIVKVCTLLSDAKAVANSKQLPFRYLSAYREIAGNSSRKGFMLLMALEAAVKQTAQNIRGFDESTSVMIACDVSGSMYKNISAKSTVRLFDVGLVLAMLLQSRCRNVQVGMFGDRWKIIDVPSESILANVQEFYKREGEVGYATNGHLVIHDLLIRGVRVDKVMIFTDLQLWNTGGSPIRWVWKAYKRVNPAAKLYLFDLAGYGTTPVQMKDGDVYLIAGWSDKIFDVLQAIEDGSNAIEKIKQVIL